MKKSLYRPRLPLFVNTGVGRALTSAKNAAFAASHWVGTVGKAAKKGFSQGQNGSKKHRPAGWLRREGHTRSLPYFLLSSSPPSLCPTFLFWSILIRQKNSLQYQTGVQIRRCASFALKKDLLMFYIYWSAIVSSWNNQFSQPLNA